VRRFALGLVRANKSKRSVKTKRKSAGWDPGYLLELLQLKISVNLDSEPWLGLWLGYRPAAPQGRLA
jgi:hypothetical protein